MLAIPYPYSDFRISSHTTLSLLLTQPVDLRRCMASAVGLTRRNRTTDRILHTLERSSCQIVWKRASGGELFSGWFDGTSVGASAVVVFGTGMDFG
jgi:hypothetical protein